MKFTCNLTFMFRECPNLTERYLLAKKAGFKAVESAFPIGFTAREVADARIKADVKHVFMNIFTGRYVQNSVTYIFSRCLDTFNYCIIHGNDIFF